MDQLLASTLALDPLIATRHSQQRCVVRLFQQCFASTRSDLSELEPGFNDPDGLLVWWVSERSPEDLKLPAWASSVVLVRMERPADLRQLVSYVHLQTLLNGKVIPEQVGWLGEAQERLAVSLQKLQEQVLPLLRCAWPLRLRCCTLSRRGSSDRPSLISSVALGGVRSGLRANATHSE